jgi:acetyltransferase-like isoleucine patch superfamily enzyme
MLNKILHTIRRIYKKIVYYITIYPQELYTYIYLTKKGVDTKFGYVKMQGLPIIYKTPGSRITLAKGVTIISNSKHNIAGINHPVILATLTKTAIIEIGKVGLSGASICAAINIRIGDNSGLGANSKIYDTDFHVINPEKRRNQNSIEEALTAPVIIDEDVWIASDVTILKGVHIGHGSVIGAGSIVTKSVPPLVIAAGNPAKVIKSII